MKEIYIADDGKQFENKEECESYEYFELKIPLVKNIEFLDENDNILSFKEREDEEKFFMNVEKIIIHSKEELRQFHIYAVDCGFISWQNIDAPGEWRWDIEHYDFAPCEPKYIYATEFDDEVYFIDFRNNARCLGPTGGRIGKKSLREVGNCFKRLEDAKAQARAEKLMRQLKMFANWHDSGKKCGECYIKYIRGRDVLVPEIIDAKNFVPFGSVVFCSLEVTYKAIEKFEDELFWYFKEYLGV